MSCFQPIDAATLADYWLADLSAAEEVAVEEHLLTCDDCGERLRRTVALADGLRDLAGEGSLRLVVSDEFVRRAAANGRKVREYSVPQGGFVQCTVTAEDDLLISRLSADLSGVGRVDLCLCDESGTERLRMKDIPVDAEAGSVAYHESMTFAKTLPTCKLVARLVAVDEHGAEKLLGEYTFDHTRSIPGAGVNPF